MSEHFDPYERWFQIPPDDQPPDHYRLLGIERFESSYETIDEAAEARVAFLHDVSTGEHVAVAQRLMNEVAAARLRLTDRDRKAAYDSELARGVVPDPLPYDPSIDGSALPPEAPPAAAPSEPTLSVPAGNQVVVVADQKANVASRNRPQPRQDTKIPPMWIAGGVGAAIILLVLLVILLTGESPSPPLQPRSRLAGDTADRQRSFAAMGQQPYTGKSPLPTFQGEADAQKQRAAQDAAAGTAAKEKQAGKQDGDKDEAQPKSSPDLITWAGLIISSDDKGIQLRSADGDVDVRWDENTAIALEVNSLQLDNIKEGVLIYQVPSTKEMIEFRLPPGPVTGVKRVPPGKPLRAALRDAKNEKWIAETGLMLRFGETHKEQLPTASNPRFVGVWDYTSSPRTLSINGTTYEISMKKGGQGRCSLFGVVGREACQPFKTRARVVGTKQGITIIAKRVFVQPVGTAADQR